MTHGPETWQEHFDEEEQGQLPRPSIFTDLENHPRWSEEEGRILRYDEVEPSPFHED